MCTDQIVDVSWYFLPAFSSLIKQVIWLNLICRREICIQHFKHFLEDFLRRGCSGQIFIKVRLIDPNCCAKIDLTHACFVNFYYKKFAEFRQFLLAFTHLQLSLLPKVCMYTY